MSVLITDFNNEGTITASGLINFHSRKLHFDYDGENVKINSGYFKALKHKYTETYYEQLLILLQTQCLETIKQHSLTVSFIKSLQSGD